jgi:hypothetical protein
MHYTLHKRDDGALAVYLAAALARQLMSEGNTRVILTFGEHTLHCALMRDQQKGHYLRLAKSHHKKWGIQEGTIIDAEIVRDLSTYQFDMPASLEEVLHSDSEAMLRWQSLRPGQQRSIIHQIGKIKSIDLQIHKSLLLAERLRNGFSDPLTILKAQP